MLGLLLLSRTVRKILTALVLAVLLVVGGTAASVWWVARDDDRPVSDVIVVLGASQADGRPGPLLRARLDHAQALFEAGVAPRVVTVGGGAPGDRTTEAAAGRDYLEARGVTAVAVEQGRNTLQSLRALSSTMAERGWRSAVLVTDPWHSLRSRRMARDLGLDAVTSPTRSGPSVQTRSTEARYVARETAAYLYYRAVGRSSDASSSALPGR